MELTVEYLRRIRSMDIPLLKHYSHLSEDELFSLSMRSLSDFLTSIIDGTYTDALKKGLKSWEEDKLPGISKTDIMPTDIVLIYYAQKITLISFLPKYTTDITLGTGIIEKLEEYYSYAQEMAFKILFKIKEEADKKEIANNILKKKVKERTRNLKEINEELENFAYTVAHDLRAPLRSINGYAHVLKEDHGRQLGEEVIRTLDIIINSARKMGMLIDDLLAYSRYGQQKTVITDIDMNELFDSAISEQINDWNPGIRIIKHDLPPVSGDSTMLSQVVNNLVSNAFKYSSKNPEPVIEIGTSKKNSVTVFYIKDNGTGFNMKYYNKLFGVFQRLHKQSEFPGTGVGLAIVKRIIGMYRGKIWAESKIGEGTTFYFTLKPPKKLLKSRKQDIQSTGGLHSLNLF